MRLEWLDDILAVAEAGSLARAAQIRHVSQSAFTRRLRAIEEALGVPLFDRRRKPVVLLPEIEAQAGEMRALATQLRHLRETLTQTSGARGLTLACQHAITTTHSPAIVSILTAQGGRPVRVRSDNRDECLLRLLSGEVDLAVLYAAPEIAPLTLNRAFEQVLLGRERLIPVAVPRLAQGDDLPFIGYPSDVFLGQVMARAILPGIAAHRVLRRRAETALTLAAREYACRGIGVAWLPEGMVAQDLKSGRLISLTESLPSQQMELWMIRLSDRPDDSWAQDWARLVAALAKPT
ncbi:DNA-binding transcriptional regulator, LysR family [Roseovarius lutimaris]|uniref:DNA-binding transcriptional regulator, LysR family n=1 Tax=Roseovarius lutimaris TaxID=1005928 RepID=A0A1I4YV99_9RHOB|nr:LysR substrate-binding domain-containing protein [Roseovarius lutimaris]SFN41944.1 DNA-binding transcriptional regulator, LysR family [Roseovarius lutimaris]